jgi:hypothetical protein
MALPLPPPTPVTNACSGLIYIPPLPVLHFKYEFTIKSVPGPRINIPIDIPEIPIYIQFPKFFNKIPKIDNGCERPRQDLIFPGYPCDLGTCTKRVCERIFGKRICVNSDYPCPRFRGQIYLEDDNFSTINLFTIPRIGLTINAESSSSDTNINVELTSNTPIVYWIDFLIDSGLSSEGITDINSVLDRLIITGQKTLFSLLSMLATYYIRQKFVMYLSIKITKLVLDIKWDLNFLSLYVGSKSIVLRDLTYTFKNVNILQLIQAESIQLTLSSKEIVFQYTLGTYDLGLNPYMIITTMIRDKIALMKSLPAPTPAWSIGAINYRSQIAHLEYALTYLETLTDVGEFIPGINKTGLNYMKKFMESIKLTVTLSLRFCPLAGVTGVCCTIGFDLTNYLNLVGDFLKNDAKDGLQFLKKYDSFSTGLDIPELNGWNNLYDQANRQITTGAGVVLDGIAGFLQNDSRFYYGSATMCAPI